MDNRDTEVAAATAAVLVDGRRVGSAVLVDDRLALTAGHAVRGDGPLELVFPRASGELRLPAERAAAATPLDAALLRVVDGPGQEQLPAAVRLSPGRRTPERVKVFGYPRDEKVLRGVWRDFDVSGPAADGTVQLDWTGDVGTHPGHSGGPVVDAGTGALVGVLVQGSQAGRFDRFVPLAALTPYLPDLPVPWLMAGADARSHFERRSLGQRAQTRGGDLFRGRRAALAAVREWLTGAGHGRPLVVTGQPGAGKSAVVARSAMDLEAARIGPGLAFHARDAVHADLLAALAELFGFAFDELPDDAAATVVVDALDEAASANDRRQMTETLTELASLPDVRVAVSTRPLAAGDRFARGGLLPALGATSADSAALVDLDTDRYFEADGLRQFAAAVLTQHEARRPRPYGAAWSAYRADPALCDRLATMVAARAGRNYLVAAMAAMPLSTSEAPVDFAAGFGPDDIPGGVGEALARFLDDAETAVRGVLTALAYARGNGVDDRTWLAFAAALGYPTTVADLDRLRTSAAADYLLQTVPDDDGPVTRLFHQALAEELLSHRHQPSDERKLLDVLRPGDGWSGGGRYAQTYAADHAAAAKQLFALLEDAHFLVHADLDRLSSLLPLEPEATREPIAVVLRQAADRARALPPARRARLLALTAAHLGLPDLSRRLAAAGDEPFVPVWAHSLGRPHQELIGHGTTVHSVATGRIGQRDVIVSAGYRLCVWDASTGRLIREAEPQIRAVRAVAMLHAGTLDLIITAGDGGVHLWDAESGSAVAGPLAADAGGAAAVAVGLVGGREVLATGHDDGSIRLWAPDGRPVGEPIVAHGGKVTAVAIGELGERDVIVSGGDDKAIRVWTADGVPVMEATNAYSVFGVALGPGGDRTVVTSVDVEVRRWDAATGEPIGEPRPGHVFIIPDMAAGRVGGRDVIATAGWDRTVRLWDAATGDAIGEPLTGHTDKVTCVAIGRAGGRDIIVSGGWDAALRVWDADADQLGDPLPGHIGNVTSLASGRIGDRDVLVTAGFDGGIRICDAESGRLIAAQPQAEAYTAVIVSADGRDTVVGVGPYALHVWTNPLEDGRPVELGPADLSKGLAAGRLGGRGVVITSGRHGLTIWDVGTGERVREFDLEGGAGPLAFAAIGDRDIIVCGARDDTIEVWDAATGRPLYGPLVGHEIAVTAVTVGLLGGRHVIVAGSLIGTIRLWDALTGAPIGAAITTHDESVEAIAIGRLRGREVIVSGCSDHTVRVRGFDTGDVTVLDMLGPVNAVAISDDGERLYVAAAHTVSMFRPEPRG